MRKARALAAAWFAFAASDRGPVVRKLRTYGAVRNQWAGRASKRRPDTKCPLCSYLDWGCALWTSKRTYEKFSPLGGEILPTWNEPRKALLELPVGPWLEWCLEGSPGPNRAPGSPGLQPGPCVPQTSTRALGLLGPQGPNQAGPWFHRKINSSEVRKLHVYVTS